MGRRSTVNDYSLPGMYHITLRVAEGMGHPLGRVVGDVNQPDGSPEGPHVELTAVGRMVEQELLTSIRTHYPMVEIQDYVVMPEHMHFIVEVHDPIVSKQGRKAHLGHVIAGFKKGCNRRYWALTGQEAAGYYQLGKTAETGTPAKAATRTPAGGTGTPHQLGKPAETRAGKPAETGAGAESRPAVYPQRWKVPSSGTTGRPVLFSAGYVDVMPLRKGQLKQQRLYIKGNPRSRLLRSTHRSLLQPQRSGIDTALTVKALMGYLSRECPPSQLSDMQRSSIENALLIRTGMIDCHSYGDIRLLERQLLPVVCHRRDQWRFAQQQEQCLLAARQGAVLVSACIAKGERAIITEAKEQGFPVVEVMDNGMPEIYHPSKERMAQCLAGRLLLVTPWQYHYRRADEGITVAECKAMNCVVQALCRTKDDWWTTGGRQAGNRRAKDGVNPPEPTKGQSPTEETKGQKPPEPTEGQSPTEETKGQKPPKPTEGPKPTKGQKPPEPTEGQSPTEAGRPVSDSGLAPLEPMKGQSPTEATKGPTPPEAVKP